MESVVVDFIEAASVPRDAWHASGDLSKANAILSQNPGIPGSDIYVSATLGDDTAIKSFIEENPSIATAKGGPRDWDPLTYLCFSRYLKLDRERSDGFVRAAKLLLDSGADPNSGWFEKEHQPKPEFEAVLYGASGISHHPELTKLLVDRGADPNDGETIYHTPESYDNRSMRVLVESGKLTPVSLALLLIRKHDWHDYDGAKYLMEHGADPNQVWGPITPFIQAIRRDNDLEIIEVALQHGANPFIEAYGISAIMLAARRGRCDLLEAFERAAFVMSYKDLDALIIACACGNEEDATLITAESPNAVAELREQGGTLLSEFTGNGNDKGVRMLLDLGVDSNARYKEGDGYFGIAQDSTALHVAGWKIQPKCMRTLLERGADPNVKNSREQTPLMMAIKGCTESYWKRRRTPECVDLLLAAGATLECITCKSGYDEIDELLISAGLKV